MGTANKDRIKAIAKDIITISVSEMLSKAQQLHLRCLVLDVILLEASLLVATIATESREKDVVAKSSSLWAASSASRREVALVNEDRLLMLMASTCPKRIAELHNLRYAHIN